MHTLNGWFPKFYKVLLANSDRKLLTWFVVFRCFLRFLGLCLGREQLLPECMQHEPSHSNLRPVGFANETTGLMIEANLLRLQVHPPSNRFSERERDYLGPIQPWSIEPKALVAATAASCSRPFWCSQFQCSDHGETSFCEFLPCFDYQGHNNRKVATSICLSFCT